MLAKERRKLVKEATAFIVQHGACPAKKLTWHQYEMETSVGLLGISFTNEGSMVSIFCRFDDPKRALACIPWVNPYSGKCNFHFTTGHAFEAAFQSFKDMIGRVIP